MEESKGSGDFMSEDVIKLIVAMNEKMDFITGTLGEHGILLARLDEKVTEREKACVDKHSSLENRVKLWAVTAVGVVLLSACGYFIKSYMEDKSERQTQINYSQPEISRSGNRHDSVFRNE